MPARLALRPVLLVVAAKVALSLPFAGRYGWQRDELYYWVAGRHVQGGYVEFPPATALLSAVARLVLGDSLVGFRTFALLAGIGATVVAALIARELGGTSRAQVLAAILVGFSPLLVATNGLFQPVSFDQLATLVVLWLALRLALGRGSWPLLGVAVGVGLETKYTLLVCVVALLAGCAIWRRDLLRGPGVWIAAAIAAALMAPNLVWEAGHDWASVRFFTNPPPSATDESRPVYLINVLLLAHPVAVPFAVAGVRRLIRDPALRPLGWTVPATILVYFLTGGKSYYAGPVVLFALAAGALVLDRSATPARLRALAVPYVALLLVALPAGLPVLPLHTAIDAGVVDTRSDYQDELGWPGVAHDVSAAARGADVVLAGNYGEAGALELYGRRGVPPVASGDVTFRFWRPALDPHARRAALVGFEPRAARAFCRDYRLVGRVRMPVDNEERGQPIARCTLSGSLADVWPHVVDAND